MFKRLFTLSFVFLFLLSFSVIYGQSQSSITDKNATYIVNPNPTVYVPDSPLEEVFGSNANTYGPAGLRGRGNVFYCTTSRILVEQRMYLNPTAAASMQFIVYEGTAFAGVYNLISSNDVPAQGPGEGWYSSGTMADTLQPGMYYLIFAQWDVNTNYYNLQNITPYPIPCSFGELDGGVGWDWAPVYSVPPAATQTSTGLENTGVAYYQTLVTDDVIPVELTSFTFNVSGSTVNLNWQTASETNNRGFEIQRKTSGEFSTISFKEGYGTTAQNHAYSFKDEGLSQGTYTYRLKQIDFDGSFNYSNNLIVKIEKPLPNSFSLNQNYPNPFNPTTTINFTLANKSHVSLKVYDLLGKQVAELVNAEKPAGEYNVQFNATNLPSGIYAYRLEAGNFVSVKKMILMK